MRSTAGHGSLFVGRSRERRLLRHLLADAEAGRPSLVVLTGIAGVGKTALAQWFGTLARERGALVGTVSCTPRTRAEDLLDRSARITGLPRRIRTGADDDAVSGTGSPERALGRMAQDVGDHLIAAARRQTLVLLVDDGHELPGSGQEALDEVVTAIDDQGGTGPLHLVIVVTARTGGADDGLATRLARLGSARPVELRGLDEQDLGELLAASDQRADPDVVARLAEDTGGLPLLAEAQIERWRRGGPAAGHPPRVGSVGAALRVRFDAVPTGARARVEELLRVAAALGDPWDPAIVRAVITPDVITPDVITPAGVARPGPGVDELVGHAGGAALIEPAGRSSGRWRFCHPLLRTSLLDRMGPAERRRLHHRIATALGTVAGDDERLLVDHADHLVRAGGLSTPAEIDAAAWPAGRLAARWLDWRLATRLLEAAAEASCSCAGPEVQATRFLAAARAAYYDTDADRCERLAGEAIRRAAAVDDTGTRLRAAILVARTRIAARSARMGQRPDLRDLDRAVEAAAGPSVVLAEGRAVLAEAHYVGGDTARGLDEVERARRALPAQVAPADEAERSRVLAIIEFSEGMNRFADLDLRAAAGCFARGVEAGARGRDHHIGGGCDGRRLLIELMTGRVERAAEGLDELRRRLDAEHLWGESALAAALGASAAALAGSASATDLLARAGALHRRSDNPFAAMIAGPVAALVRSRVGLVDEALRPVLELRSARSSVVAVLAAVEAGDEAAVQATVESAGWRHGPRRRLSPASLLVGLALVQAGDLLDRPVLGKPGREPLRLAYERGCVVTPDWPVLIPRVLAAGARQEGELVLAERYLAHAEDVARREGLDAEVALTEFERIRLDRVLGAGPETVSDRLARARRRFVDGGMAGWAARAAAAAERWGLGPVLDAGTVARACTIVTTDVVGSTATNARLGDALYVEQLRVHDRLCRARIREFHGTEIKHTGDGLNIVFDDAHRAVACVLAMQADLRAWAVAEPDLALAVRCGLARGDLVRYDGDLFGLTQSEAARLCALAEAGEVILSAAVRAAVLDAGLVLEDLGERSLRGLPGGSHVYRLVSETD